MTPADLLNEPWAFGPACFVIDAVQLLPEPIPCRGMQGWWPLDAEMRELLSKCAQSLVRSALTLQQPYASAIAVGPKRVENRPVGRHIPREGLWVGLHAGKTLYCPEYLVEGGTPSREELLTWWREALAEWRREMWPDAPVVEDLPRGVMLGAMHITACLRYPDPEPKPSPYLVDQCGHDEDETVEQAAAPQPAEEELLQGATQLGLFGGSDAR